MSTIRAVRNHNPGNIDSGQPWLGLMKKENMTPEQRAEPRFAVFATDAYGFRALARLLLNYEYLHNLNTVQGIINRWAPPVENSTGNYVNRVCAALDVQPDGVIDLHNPDILAKMAKAIATVECGGWFFTDDALRQGIAMAEG